MANQITTNLAYLQGVKGGIGSSGDEFFQRKISDGTIEYKYVDRNRSSKFTTFKIKSGDFVYVNNRLIKTDIENYKLEATLAEKTDRPYEYIFKNDKIVGTNDCIVVARVASSNLLEAIKNSLYPGYIYTNTQDSANAPIGDFGNYLIAETQTYIRKSDAVIMGELLINKAGHVSLDKLYDWVQVNVPIPAEKFALPEGSVLTATNSSQYLKLITSGSDRNRETGQTKVFWIRFLIIGMVLTIPFYFFYQTRRN